MNRIYIAILAAAIGPLALAPLCHADDKPAANPLDRALDDSSDSAKPATPKPDAAKPAKPEPAQDALNPDAASALDDNDLVDKLTGKGPKGDEGPEAMIKDILKRMDTSAQRLHKQDPGAMTQETQKRITLNLDQLIELVRQQEQQQQQQSKSQGKKPGQKREMTKGKGQGQEDDPQKKKGNEAAKNSQLPDGAAGAPEANNTDINQHSREWGNLPEHERDLIILGQKQDALPSYKELIQRYYQSLAEINKTTRDR